MLSSLDYWVVWDIRHNATYLDCLPVFHVTRVPYFRIVDILRHDVEFRCVIVTWFNSWAMRLIGQE